MLDVSGMKCGGCSASVKRILLSNEGVQHAAVNLLTETAVVKLTPVEGSAEKAAELLTTKVGPAIIPSLSTFACMSCVVHRCLASLYKADCCGVEMLRSHGHN